MIALNNILPCVLRVSVISFLPFFQIGGKIEFAEAAQACIVREVYEELQADITNIHYLGTIKHIYTLNGNRGHGLILLFSAAFVTSTFYENDPIIGLESDQASFIARWLPIIVSLRQNHALIGPPDILSLWGQYQAGIKTKLLTIQA